MDLKDRRALVTGASRGIGLAIAESFAGVGMKVFLTARNEETLAQVKNNLQERNRQIEYFAADLVDFGQIEKMFYKAMEFLGGIDVLVNNAGIGINGPVVEMDISEWDETMGLNLRAPFILSKMAAQKMISQGSGHIINVGSGASQTPIANFAGYCASKFGLFGFSESLALELREYGIKVSIVLSGSTATYFNNSDPESKLKSKPGLLRPEDVANSVIYLLQQSPNAWTSIMNLRPLNPNKK